MCDECNGTCHASMMERSRARLAAGREPNPKTGERMARSKQLHQASQKMNAPGYACDGICDVDQPAFVRRALANLGLAPPAALTPEEREAEEAQRARALGRALGGPYGGTQLSRALIVKAKPRGERASNLEQELEELEDNTVELRARMKGEEAARSRRARVEAELKIAEAELG
jgi:hypothetical protein